jgi:hypothetical protein
MSCACGSCQCKGKAVVEQDEYDGLVELSKPNIEMRVAAQQLIQESKRQELPTIIKAWIERLERSFD